MRILYFHQHFTTPDGASGTRSYEFAKRLVGNGHEVIVVCGSFRIGSTGLDNSFNSGFRRGFVDGIDIIEFELPYSNEQNLLKRSFVFLRYAFKGIFISLTETYDVIFATSTPLTAGIPGITARWCRRKPFVFEVRDSWPELPIAMGVVTNPLVIFMLRILEQLTYLSANHLIGLAPGIIRDARAKGVAERKCTLIPNGCDLEFLGQPRVLSENTIRMVFTGAHGRANGLHHILNVARELKIRGRKDIQITFVGEGSEKANLLVRATQEGLDNCQFLAAMPKRELIEYLKTCHFGIMCLENIPSFYNGTSPNKFFDYLASGLPIAINYPGWISDLIENYGCGFVAEPGNVQEFVNKLLYILDNPQSVTKMSQASIRLSSQFLREDLSSLFEKTLIQAIG